MLSKNKLKTYQQLKSRKFRQKYGLFVVEGRKSVSELLHSHWEVECIVSTDASPLQGMEVGDVEWLQVDARGMAQLSSLKTPPGVLAIVRTKVQQAFGGPWALALDGISDPGNLGTIIRIADWYGIHDIYCSEDTVELYNPKVIQASMGSFLRVRVIPCELSAALKDRTVYATLLTGTSIRELKAEKGVLLIGNEANGIRTSLLQQIEHRPVTIPGNTAVESLNAAVATAICCERLIA